MIRLLAEKVLYIQDKLLFVSCESNSIFSLDLTTGDVQIRGFIRGEEMFGNRLFGGLFEYNGKYILIPANSNRVILTNKDFVEEKIIKSVDSSSQLKYMAGVVYKNYLFMFNHGTGVNSIRRISLIDYSETELNDIYDCHFFDCLVEDNNILLPSCNSNIIIQLNLDTLEMEKFEVSKGKYNSIERFSGDYYLAPREGNLLVIWKEDKNIEEISIPKCNAIGVIKMGGSVILPSNVYGGSLRIDQNGNITKWHSEERFILSERVSENTYVLMNDNAIVYVVNMTDECIVKYYAELQDAAVLIEEIRNNKANTQRILHESKLNNLDIFLGTIAYV